MLRRRDQENGEDENHPDDRVHPRGLVLVVGDRSLPVHG
jgi:hypothetical protein